MNSTTLLRAADDATSSLLQWGLGGAVLVVFVVPIFYSMARNAQKREDARMEVEKTERAARLKIEEDERAARDEERKARFAQDLRDSELRAERERKLVDALVASVEQQKLALDQWRRFEEQEEKVHAAILTGLAQVTQTLAQIADRMTTTTQATTATATAQTQLAQLLSDVAAQIQTLKRTA